MPAMPQSAGRLRMMPFAEHSFVLAPHRDWVSGMRGSSGSSVQEKG